MFRSFGLPEIAIILVIILIFFGVGKLPQMNVSRYDFAVRVDDPYKGAVQLFLGAS